MNNKWFKNKNFIGFNEVNFKNFFNIYFVVV